MGYWTAYFEHHKDSQVYSTVKVACAKFDIDQELQNEDKSLEAFVNKIMRILRSRKTVSGHSKSLTDLEVKQTHEVQQTKLKTALDLGCGTGGDTVYLLENRFSVTALDGEAEAFDFVRTNCKKRGISDPKFVVSKFEEMNLKDPFDLINASLALPFIKPENLEKVWRYIVQHIKEEGRFSGHFFGERHQWVKDPKMTFLPYHKLLSLFKSDFVIEFLEEEKDTADTVSQGKQFWHQWDIVARKKTTHPERPLRFSISSFSCIKATHDDAKLHKKRDKYLSKPSFFSY